MTDRDFKPRQWRQVVERPQLIGLQAAALAPDVEVISLRCRPKVKLPANDLRIVFICRFLSQQTSHAELVSWSAENLPAAPRK